MKYRVHLSEEQQEELRKLIRVGKAPARTLTHARILLKADYNGDGLKDPLIAQMLEVHRSTVQRVRQHFCEDGLKRSYITCSRDALSLHVWTAERRRTSSL